MFLYYTYVSFYFCLFQILIDVANTLYIIKTDKNYVIECNDLMRVMSRKGYDNTVECNLKSNNFNKNLK